MWRPQVASTGAPTTSVLLGSVCTCVANTSVASLGPAVAPVLLPSRYGLCRRAWDLLRLCLHPSRLACQAYSFHGPQRAVFVHCPTTLLQLVNSRGSGTQVLVSQSWVLHSHRPA